MIRQLTPTTLFANLNQSTFDERFNRRPFTIEHHLCAHELFNLPRLIELSQALPESRVEYNSGNLPISQDPHATPRNGLSISDTIARIEECNSWMVLKNVELAPSYAELLDDCLAEIQPFSNRVTRGMAKRQGFIFISSPGSVTPYHIDPENNFLLQLRGTKTVHMFPQYDREILSEQNLEAFFSGTAHRNLPFEPWYNERCAQYNLEPGDGLHFPVAAPHWVQNGPEVSISFSITFQTQDSTDRQSLHRLNRQLRKFGITPKNVGLSLTRDQLKLRLVNGIRGVKQLLGKSEEQQKSY